jgi:hypothetical protein
MLVFIINYSAKIASIVSSVAKHFGPSLLRNSYVFSYVSVLHNMEKMKNQYAMELHRMQLLSSRDPQARNLHLLFYVRNALSPFCELGRIFLYLSCSLILVFFAVIFVSCADNKVCKLLPVPYLSSKVLKAKETKRDAKNTVNCMNLGTGSSNMDPKNS